MNHHQPDPYTLMASLPEGQLQDVLMQLALAHPADFEAAVKHAQILALAAASRGNPYDSSVEAKHGRYDAQSAADVARSVPHLAQHTGADPVCVLCHIDHDAARRSVTTTTELLPGHMPQGAQ